eukprot:10182160-Alexandrium_andersonii.AAC.1
MFCLLLRSACAMIWPPNACRRAGSQKKHRAWPRAGCASAAICACVLENWHGPAAEPKRNSFGHG